jgi:hypothetical protein
MTPETLERINVARYAVRQAIAGGTLELIHPFDLAKLLANPTTLDAVIVHVDDRQYIVIDGTAFRCTSDVKNETKLSDMMAKPETAWESLLCGTGMSGRGLSSVLPCKISLRLLRLLMTSSMSKRAIGSSQGVSVSPRCFFKGGNMQFLANLDASRAEAIIEAAWGLSPKFSEDTKPLFDEYAASIRSLIGKPVKLQVLIKEVKGQGGEWRREAVLLMKFYSMIALGLLTQMSALCLVMAMFADNLQGMEIYALATLTTGSLFAYLFKRL